MSAREQAEMDRIRAARGLPPLRDTRQLMFERVAGARCYLDRGMSTSNPAAQERAELLAFMAIFHPEVPTEQAVQLANGVPL